MVESFVWGSIGIALGAAITAALTAVLKPSGEYLGEYLVGRLKYIREEKEKKLRLHPEWKTTWSYEDKPGGTDIMTIEQSGPFIIGHAKGVDIDYAIKAKLNPDRTIEGTWDTSGKGRFWKGNFYLLVDVNGDTIKGKWAGQLGKGDKIRGGDWTWKAIR